MAVGAWEGAGPHQRASGDAAAQLYMQRWTISSTAYFYLEDD